MEELERSGRWWMPAPGRLGRGVRVQVGPAMGLLLLLMSSLLGCPMGCQRPRVEGEARAPLPESRQGSPLSGSSESSGDRGSGFSLPVGLLPFVDSAADRFHSWQGPGETWWVPQDAFFAAEGDAGGIWLKGASEAQVLVVRQVPESESREPATSLTVASLAQHNVLWVESSGGRVEVSFSLAPRRQAVPVRIPLGPPVGSLGENQVYRLKVRSSRGRSPRQSNPKSSDGRFLGVFFSR